MKKIYARIIGEILLGLGIVMLIVSIILFVNPSESALSGLLLIVSIIANVAGIMFLSYTPARKKK